MHGGTFCARRLRINVVCNNRITEIPPVEDVVELRGCEYAITLNSQYGCPRECPTHDELICGGRGLCASAVPARPSTSGKKSAPPQRYDGVESGATIDGAAGRAMCLCKSPYGIVPFYLFLLQ